MLADATEQIVIDAEMALSVTDPWLAVVTFFETTAARQAADRGLYQSLAGLGRSDDKVRIWPQIVSKVTLLFARAKEAGAIREDAEPEDAVLMLAMLGVVFGAGGTAAPDLWRRYLGLMLDGLRATDRPSLPLRTPRFTTLDDVIATSKRRPHGR